MLPWLWYLAPYVAIRTGIEAYTDIWQHWNAILTILLTPAQWCRNDRTIFVRSRKWYQNDMPSLTPEREEACLRFGLFLINEQEHGNDEDSFLRLLKMYQRNFSKAERRWMTEKWVEIREAAVAMKLDNMKRSKERGGMFG